MPGASAFARDVASLTTIRLIGVASGFLTTVLAARLLGASELGVAGVAQTVGTVVALIANGGLSMSTIYLLRRSPDDAARLAGALGTLVLVSAIFAALAGGAGAMVLGWLSVPGLPGLTAVATALLAAATIAVETSGAQLLGLGQARAYAISEAIRGLGILAGTAVLILVVTSATGYVLGAAAGLGAAALYAQSRSRRQTGPVRLTVDRAIWREALHYGLRGQLGNALQYVSLRIDLVLVAAVLGPVPAGIYLVATRVSEAVTQIANAAASLLFPAVAGQADRSSTFTATTVRFVLAAVIVSSLVVGLASWVLLPVVFGPTYSAGLPSLWILLVAAVPLSLGRLLAGDLKGRGRPGLVSAAALVGVVITITGNVALLGTWGIEAAAIVSIAAYGAVAIALALAYRSVSGGPLRELVPGPADVAVLWRTVLAVAKRRPGRVDWSRISRRRGGGTPPSGPG